MDETMLTITEVEPDRADALARFLQSAYAHAYAGRHGITTAMFLNDAFHQRTRDALQQGLGRGDSIMLTLTDDAGGIHATIGLRPDPDEPATAEIWGFYVEPDLQGRGFGRLLWDALLGDERAAPFAHLYLFVITGSEDVVAFYRRRGFSVDDGERSWNWPSWDPPPTTPYLTLRRRR
jgi:ribosomal protein S18 acetylase RimI-like enzyme